jgi:hypothetical protein
MLFELNFYHTVTHTHVFYIPLIYLATTRSHLLFFSCILGSFVPSASLLLPLEFETIFSAMGLPFQISGATIMATFTVPMNIIKSTIATKPAFAKFLAYEILCSNAKKDEIANKPTIGTADETKTERFGNSNGEKEDIVNRIKIPEMTVASTMIMSLALRFVEGEEEVDDDILLR